MDVARRNQNPDEEVALHARKALVVWLASLQPAAVTNFRGRIAVRLLRVARRSPGPDYKERSRMGLNSGEGKKMDRFCCPRNLEILL